MLVHWVWFAHRPGLNDRDKMALLQHFRDPEDIYFADDGAFDASVSARTQRLPFGRKI